MHSFGQKLLHELGVEQCTSFFCASIPMGTRLNWANSLPKIELRDDVKKLKDTSIFLILSQNCDIACRNDKLDSHVEICVCKKIKEKEHNNYSNKNTFLIVYYVCILSSSCSSIK